MLCYIDPSSMTYLIQIIAGVVIAAGAGLAFYWKRIKRFFNKKSHSDENLRSSSSSENSDSGEIFTAEMIKNAASHSEKHS